MATTDTRELIARLEAAPSIPREWPFPDAPVVIPARLWRSLLDDVHAAAALLRSPAERGEGSWPGDAESLCAAIQTLAPGDDSLVVTEDEVSMSYALWAAIMRTMGPSRARSLASPPAPIEGERERILAAIDAEPELPGSMPDEMWEAVRGDRDATEEALRIVVRQTKDGIRARALAALPVQGERAPDCRDPYHNRYDGPGVAAYCPRCGGGRRDAPERPRQGEREEGEAEARDSGARQTPAEAVEEYIRALPWSDGTPDEVRTLVADNIRGFAYWRSRRGECEEGTGEARDTLVRVACGIADNAPWRQSPDMDILKSVVQEYRAASPAPSAPEGEG